MTSDSSLRASRDSKPLSAPLLPIPTTQKVELQECVEDPNQKYNQINTIKPIQVNPESEEAKTKGDPTSHKTNNSRHDSRANSIADLGLLHVDETQMTMVNYLNKGTEETLTFPSVLEWARPAELKKNFLPDLMAGLTVAAVLCSEALAISIMAELPPHYGLYASAVPVMVYALFGSSKNVTVGPIALVGILLGSILKDIDDENEKVSVALFLSFMTGSLMVLLGILRMGFIEYLLSVPAIKGFITGIAFNIIMQQIQNVFQINFQKDSNIPRLCELFRRAGEWNKGSLMIGIAVVIFLAGLMIIKEIKQSKNLIFFLGPLLTSVIGTVVVNATRMDTFYGINLVRDIEKDIPSGLGVSYPFSRFFTYCEEYFDEVIVLTFIGYVETFASSKEVAAHKGYKIDANIEFVSLGIANLSSAFLLAFPIFGSLSRIPLNVAAGNRSQLSGFITGLTITVLCYVGIPIIELIPLCVVGATIIFTIAKKIALYKLYFLLKYYTFPDGIIMGLAAFTTIIFSPEVGASVTVFCSILIILKKGTTPWLDIEHYKTEVNAEDPDSAPQNAEKSPGTNKSIVRLNTNIKTNDKDKYKALTKSNKHKDKSMMMMSFKDWDQGKYKEFCLCLNLHCNEKFHLLIITLPKDFYYFNSHSLRINLEPLKALSPQFKESREGIDIHENIPSKTINAILIDCHKTKHIDFTACRTIIEVVRELGKTGIQIALSELDLALLKPMKAAGLDPKIASYGNRDTVEMVEKLMDKVLIDDAEKRRQQQELLAAEDNHDTAENEGLSQ